MSAQNRRSLSLYVSFTTLLLLSALQSGCQRGEIDDQAGGPTTDELVGYYSPTQIRLLPFTKIRSFDDDLVPDGVAVSLRPLDGAGDPVKAYGSFLFELYEYRQATADRRGRRLQAWRQTIHTLDEQRTFWERVTSTYEFQLSWEGEPLPIDRKYILAASFEAPGADRLFDDYVFEFRLPPQAVPNNASASAQ